MGLAAEEFFSVADLELADGWLERLDVATESMNEAQTDLYCEAAMALCADMKARCQTSSKSLANIYRFVMDGVLKRYKFSRRAEPALRSMLLTCWERGPELKHALRQREASMARPLSLRQVWTAGGESGVSDVVVTRDMSEMILQPWETPYSISREAGCR